MSHNKANLTKEEYICEAEDLVCDYAKGSSFKCNACLKSKSGRVKCSWVAELIKKVVVLANGEELATCAPKGWFAFILEMLHVLGAVNQSITAQVDHPAHGTSPAGGSVEKAADNAGPSSQIDDDARVATDPVDSGANGRTPSTEIVNDGGFAEEQGDAPAHENISRHSTPVRFVDDAGGVREEGDRAQDGSPNGSNAEEEAYGSTHSRSPSIAWRDREPSPRYFRTPSMELPSDLEDPTHDGTPSFRVPPSPAYFLSESDEAPDYRDHLPQDWTSHLGVAAYDGSAAHMGTREDEEVVDGMLGNLAQGGTPSVGVSDAGDREELDSVRDINARTQDADTSHSHFGFYEEEELRVRALELLAEIQDKTEEYFELSNLAELSSRCLPHLMEEAASPKEVSEVAAPFGEVGRLAGGMGTQEHPATSGAAEGLAQANRSARRSALADEGCTQGRGSLGIVVPERAVENPALVGLTPFRPLVGVTTLRPWTEEVGMGWNRGTSEHKTRGQACSARTERFLTRKNDDIRKLRKTSDRRSRYTHNRRLRKAE
ncbi:uncharacterized protein TRAVEDRAFT_23914 [Trametes versicolor FP-101664 SS1]|uniref:uncharacterized protein n=1 Tax=Trametes versicolor (strain FP-101664) TaxID=717944 RepID=UPI0004621FE2|nr:uncharacterized protein TRAVEDRAFT_23914 [Trametes versicolor FP-101664 SS1]EIW53637.1 hypothetical protein TRAVEDRAFT_23914 [Trametes versicolor FP-101664 SS1]